MDRLISFDASNPVPVRIESGRRCSGELSLLNVMHTMPVAFRIQPINRATYAVRPESGIIFPLSTVKVEIIFNMAPNMALPESPNFPFAEDSFVLHSVVVPGAVAKDAAANSVPHEWFLTRRKQVFIDSGIKIVFVGASVLVKLVMSGEMDKVRDAIELSGSESANSVDESGRSLLHLAVIKNRADLVQMLLEFEPDINAHSNSGSSPLEAAAASGNALIVELLLAHGANMERSGPSQIGPIHLAARQGHVEVLKLLLLKGADVESPLKDGRTALHIAAEERRRDCTRLLLASGAKTDVPTYATGDTPLHIAAAQGDRHLVHLLLQKGANKWVQNKSGKTAYDLAAEEGHSKLYDALKLGDDLCLAAKMGDVRKVERLIENGALLNGKDQHGWTALHRASFKGKTDLVRILIEKGIALHSKDQEGYTALHCATESGFPEVVELLVKRGADVDARTNKGITALQIAETLNFPGIARLLVQGGATRDSAKAVVPYQINFTTRKESETKGFKKIRPIRTRNRRNNLELSAPLSVI
uniref:MSP domain-containing protein n=1 Tax=Kalanchoe fedtschenkoi TaxID=63787 RepID=A0A7N0TNE5_KALFE